MRRRDAVAFCAVHGWADGACIYATLTGTERYIAALLQDGLPNKQIAYVLGIREQTVKNRLTLMYVRLALRCRTDLALLLERHGCQLETPP